MSRPSWDQYFIGLAYAAAERATCDRRKVGAVLVNKAKDIVATGYNGSPAGLPHCDDAGHELVEIDGRHSCIRTLHAESNALDRAGKDARGCDLYVTCTPCYECAKRIISAGVVRVVYGEYYGSRASSLVADLFQAADVPLTMHAPNAPARAGRAVPWQVGMPHRAHVIAHAEAHGGYWLVFDPVAAVPYLVKLSAGDQEPVLLFATPEASGTLSSQSWAHRAHYLPTSSTGLPVCYLPFSCQ